MNEQIRAIKAEFIKNRHSKIKWVTFLAFAFAPMFGGVFMYMMSDAGYEGLSGAFKSKAVMMSFEANWNSYLSLLSQAVGIGGVLIFGFIVSWLFGREYSEGTAKDLLALPISRVKIINAKFIYYMVWGVALVISNMLLCLLIGFSLGIEGLNNTILIDNLKIYFITTFLTLLLNTPVAYFALWGKGYLAPLGLVVILLVLAQVLGAMGLGAYFPWSIPGIFSGSGGIELKSQLNIFSYLIIILTSIIGYIATIIYWKYADQE